MQLPKLDPISSICPDHYYLCPLSLLLPVAVLSLTSVLSVTFVPLALTTSFHIFLYLDCFGSFSIEFCYFCVSCWNTQCGALSSSSSVLLPLGSRRIRGDLPALLPTCRTGNEGFEIAFSTESFSFCLSSLYYFAPGLCKLQRDHIRGLTFLNESAPLSPRRPPALSSVDRACCKRFGRPPLGLPDSFDL